MARVLIIEDDDAMRRLVVRTLVAGGHDVIEAVDGREGMRIFREQAPDIVVSDIVMPHRDGIETIREIHAASPATGIIAMSGAGHGRVGLYLTAAEQFGADAVLQKPFRPDQLTAAIDRLVETRRAAEHSQEAPPGSASVKPPPAGATVRILVIDDDELIRRVISRTLAGDRYHVIEATDGRIGMQLFRDQAPNLVITDIVMPNRDGIEMIRQIRETGSVVRIIAMSGGGVRAGELFLTAATQYGADAILQKPFRPETLLTTVESVLGQDLPPT
jgi:DNA-binding response OmpR family regulator